MEKHTPHMKGFLYIYFIDRRRGPRIHVQKTVLNVSIEITVNYLK